MHAAVQADRVIAAARGNLIPIKVEPPWGR